MATAVGRARTRRLRADDEEPAEVFALADSADYIITEASIAMSQQLVAEVVKRALASAARSTRWLSNTMEEDDVSWSIPDMFIGEEE